MKDLKTYLPVLIILMMLTLSGCEIIGDIFKAGMYMGIIAVVLVVLIIMWILRKFRGRS